jgi:hypothetical protein
MRRVAASGCVLDLPTIATHAYRKLTKDERAAAWYERFGALRLLDDPLRLVLALDTIRATLRR